MRGCFRPTVHSTQMTALLKNKQNEKLLVIKSDKQFRTPRFTRATLLGLAAYCTRVCMCSVQPQQICILYTLCTFYSFFLAAAILHRQLYLFQRLLLFFYLCFARGMYGERRITMYMECLPPPRRGKWFCVRPMNLNAFCI